MKKIFFCVAIAAALCSMASCTKASLDEAVINPTEARIAEASTYTIAVSVISDGVNETTITVMDENKTGIYSTLVTDDEWNSGSGLAIDLKTKKNPAFIYSADAEGDGFVALPSESIATKAGPVPVTIRLVKK